MRTWSEVAEIQPLASKIITNSIKKGRLSHAYLIHGERGTGKEAIAALIAKTIFCENKDGVQPCNNCSACKRIESRNHPDVHWIEPDGASIKIEQIRNLQKEFTYSGLESNQKVYVVKGAETLTPNAANRILKFLEEPSKKTTAMMLTENTQSILPTIRSRCQMIDLQPLSPSHFVQKLIENGLKQQDAILMSALTNNLDEAIELNHNEWFAEARKLVLQLVETIANHPNDTYLFIHSHWMPHFKDKQQQEQGLDLLLLLFKDILYYHVGRESSIVFLSNDQKRLESLGMKFSQEKLVTILQNLLKAKQGLKQNVHQTLLMEEVTLQIQG